MDENFLGDERYEEHEIPNILPDEAEGMQDDDIILDDSSITFCGHQEPVFCLDILKDTSFILTGGQDEVAYVWDFNTNTELAKIEGHKDSISNVSFHQTEKYLATADMLGLIQVFATETKQKVWSFECGRDLELMFWHPIAKVLFAGLSDGDLYMLKVGTDEMKCYSGGGNGISAAKLSHSGTEVLIGYNDSKVKCWNLKTCSVMSSCKLSTSENPVLQIAVSTTAPDQYFACHAEKVCLVHMKTGKILSSFSHADTAFFTNQPQASSSEDIPDSSIQTFSICPSHKNFLVLGRNNGAVETWDTSAKSPRNAAYVSGGVTKIVFAHSQEPICLVATSSGFVFCFDALTGSILRQFHGHGDAIHDLILSNDETFFVTCSDDCTVKVFHMT